MHKNPHSTLKATSKRLAAADTVYKIPASSCLQGGKHNCRGLTLQPPPIHSPCKSCRLGRVFKLPFLPPQPSFLRFEENASGNGRKPPLAALPPLRHLLITSEVRGIHVHLANFRASTHRDNASKLSPISPDFPAPVLSIWSFHGPTGGQGERIGPRFARLTRADVHRESGASGTETTKKGGGKKNTRKEKHNQPQLKEPLPPLLRPSVSLPGFSRQKFTSPRGGYFAGDYGTLENRGDFSARLRRAASTLPFIPASSTLRKNRHRARVFPGITGARQFLSAAATRRGDNSAISLARMTREWSSVSTSV